LSADRYLINLLDLATIIGGGRGIQEQKAPDKFWRIGRTPEERPSPSEI
jgi:hypothetical protein